MVLYNLSKCVMIYFISYLGAEILYLGAEILITEAKSCKHDLGLPKGQEMQAMNPEIDRTADIRIKNSKHD